MSDALAQTVVPPGWYPDPWGQPGQRWWDGATWTAHFAAYAAPTQGAEARTSDWVGGVLLSVLIPIVGLIAGIVYVTKSGSRRTVGIMCICISLSMMLLWMIISAAGSASGY